VGNKYGLKAESNNKMMVKIEKKEKFFLMLNLK